MTNYGILVSPQDRQMFAVQATIVIYACTYDCRIDKCVDINEPTLISASILGLGAVSNQ